MTARLVVAVTVGRPSWLWRVPVAGVLIVFYLACLVADVVQSEWRAARRRFRHGR